MLTQSCFFVRSYTSHRFKGKKLLSSDQNKIRILRASFEERSKQKVRVRLMADCSSRQSDSQSQKIIHPLGNIEIMVREEAIRLSRKKQSLDLTCLKNKSRNSTNSLVYQSTAELNPENTTDSVNVSANQTYYIGRNRSVKKMGNGTNRKQELMRRLKSAYEDEKVLDKVISSFEEREHPAETESTIHKLKRRYRKNPFFKPHKTKVDLQSTNYSEFSSQNNLVRLLHSEERRIRTSESVSRRTTLGLKPGVVSR